MTMPLSLPENSQLEAKVNALQETIETLQSLPSRMAELERRVLGTNGRVGEIEIATALCLAHEITRDMFSRPYQCIEKEDCEISADRYFEFRVVDEGDIDAVLARDAEWHRRIAGLPANAIGLFRLAVNASK